MSAQDVGAEVLGWALDEAQKQCFGEDFGISVQWGVAQVPVMGGMQAIPAWNLLVTMRNPMLGEGPLYHLAPLFDPKKVDMHVRPQQPVVRKAVTEGMRLLRELARSKAAPANGHAKVALPGG